MVRMYITLVLGNLLDSSGQNSPAELEAAATMCYDLGKAGAGVDMVAGGIGHRLKLYVPGEV